MKASLFVVILGLFFLVGCVPDFVSVSRDGTIAFTLTDEGKFEPVDADSQHVYLTNANADFLEKIEGLEGCGYPQISPSGRYIVALADDSLVLYDRETEKRRVIQSPPKGDDDLAARFAVWSPDEKKIAFFVGDFDDDPPDCTLKVYDVKRREMEVLERRASPRAAWLPNGKRLLYVSLPPGVSEHSGEPRFGNLNIINVKTAKKETLARRQLFAYTAIAVFPNGKAILYPCLDWGNVEFGPAGITTPLVLRKELLALAGRRTAKRETEGRVEEEAPRPEEVEAKPDAEKAQPAPREEEPEEKGFVLYKGQPFQHYTCAVSPDGKRIAYVRYVWTQRAKPVPVEEEQTEEEKRIEVEGEAEQAGEESAEAAGVEFCVARADGSDGIPLVRSMGEGPFAQVLWLNGTRLICVTAVESASGIILVDADGKNRFDLIEAIRSKFADRFKPEEEKEETDSEEEAQ